ncbi:MAG: cytochrome c oxidase, subunit [Phycisphaerales bacterium]|nr:cytochrome c oxidase, subunit [Phycisphaerales bacterium]
MDERFRLFPEEASTLARETDHLLYYLLGVSVFFTLLIFVFVVYFALRYRRRSDNEFPPEVPSPLSLEITWSVVPFILMMGMFFWGASLYVQMKRPPANAMQINVVGKQWMWKVQHPNGAREINELHVPTGRTIRLMMASQDVVHSFFIPAFRIKQDVIPGSFVTQWFIATKPGTYHLFCSQYCGTEHSKMVGRVIVLRPEEYEAWLAGAPPDEPPPIAGGRLFVTYGCVACHSARAPTMAGLYGSRVQLDDGSTTVADDAYLRESIIEPGAKVVAGYPPVMPSYRGQLSEEQLIDLVAYIKSLGAGASTEGGVRPLPATRPVNGFSPDRAPNYPPARQTPGAEPVEVERGRLGGGREK